MRLPESLFCLLSLLVHGERAFVIKDYCCLIEWNGMEWNGMEWNDEIESNS